MEPEIARRCVNCGAAVRGRASFCPQCGQSMSEASALNRATADAARPQASGLVDEAERVARELNESVPPVVVPTSSAPGDNKLPLNLAAQAAQTEASGHTAAPQTQLTDTDVVPVDAQPVDGRGGARFERASAMRARAGERVERLREASFVVLDEAQDDPALRFVLIAAALFVLFLLILLLSHILS